MKREDLFTRHASLWPRLRRLSLRRGSLTSSRGIKGLFPLLVIRCSSLRELTFSTDLPASTLNLQDVPPSLEDLRIELRASASNEHGPLLDSSWEPSFLSDIVASGMLPALRSLYVQLPTAWREPRVQTVTDQFVERLDTRCRVHGVRLVVH